jgi:hypothetical protein
MPETRIDFRYAGWLTAIILLLALPAFGGFASIGWEICQLAGYLGALACLLLTGAPLRPRASSPPTLVSLRRHSLIGCGALAAVAVHAAGLVLADGTVLEYLKPSAPLHQLAGIAAAAALSFLVFGSLAAARRRLWHSHRGFQATHIVIAYLLAVLVTAHVAVTARYLGGPGRRALFAAAAVSAVLMLMRARRPAASGPAAQAAVWARRARHPLVFGRHSTSIVVTAAACVACIAALVPASVDATLREPAMSRATGLALDFPHEKHGAVNCLTCHHNYADGTGMQACIECHRGPRTDLKEGVEARFHGFCLDCHRHPGAALREHGPVAGCAVCHHAPLSGAPALPSSADR